MHAERNGRPAKRDAGAVQTRIDLSTHASGGCDFIVPASFSGNDMGDCRKILNNQVFDGDPV
jgi:hypothetical protein